MIINRTRGDWMGELMRVGDVTDEWFSAPGDWKTARSPDSLRQQVADDK